VFIKDSVYKKPDIQMLPFPTYFGAEDDDNAEPLVADLGEVDPFMVAD
jgi:large subunit ribosomal protein L3